MSNDPSQSEQNGITQNESGGDSQRDAQGEPQPHCDKEKNGGKSYCRIASRYFKKLFGWVAAKNVAAIAAIAAAIVAGFALNIADKHLISDNRAWLAPMTASLDWTRGEFGIGKPIYFIIHHQNVGGEPALGFVAQESVKSFPNPGQRSYYSTFTPDRIEEICRVTHASDSGLVVYPSDAVSGKYTVTEMLFPVTEDIMEGREILYIEGCFAYKTFGEEHKSAYCFMLVPRPGFPPTGWTFSDCMYGNSAY